MSGIRQRPKIKIKVHYSDPAVTREYAITEAATEDEAVQAILGEALETDTINGVTHYLESIELNEFGGGAWDATAHYSKSTEQVEMNFDIGAGSSKMTVALQEVSAYNCIDPGDSDASDIPDFKCGINYNGNAFEGVDVEIPKLEFTVTRKKRISTLEGAYLQTLFAMSQTVNDAEYTIVFRGQTFIFAKGSLRFRGARVREDSDDSLDITYAFAYSKSIAVTSYTAWDGATNYVAGDKVTVSYKNYRALRATVGDAPATSTDDWEEIFENITIGDSRPITKEGWHYISIFFDEKKDDAGFLIKRPYGAYVYRVYDYSDFSNLELGLDG